MKPETVIDENIGSMGYWLCGYMAYDEIVEHECASPKEAIEYAISEWVKSDEVKEIYGMDMTSFIAALRHLIPQPPQVGETE